MMYKKTKLLAGLALAAGIVSGCSTVHPAVSNVVDLKGTDFRQEMKSGQACEYYVLFFGPFGSRDLAAAARKGDVKDLRLVEYKSDFYGLAGRHCVSVRGF